MDEVAEHFFCAITTNTPRGEFFMYWASRRMGHKKNA
jgi:hypothetical protein